MYASDQCAIILVICTLVRVYISPKKLVYLVLNSVLKGGHASVYELSVTLWRARHPAEHSVSSRSRYPQDCHFVCTLRNGYGWLVGLLKLLALKNYPPDRRPGHPRTSFPFQILNHNQRLNIIIVVV